MKERAVLDQGDLKALADSDALKGLSSDRLHARWGVMDMRLTELPLAPIEDDRERPPMAKLTLGQEVISDYASTGLTLRAHPMKLLRAQFDGVYCASDLVKVKSAAVFAWQDW